MGVIAVAATYTAVCVGKTIIIYDNRNKTTQLLEQSSSSQTGAAGSDSYVVCARFSRDERYLVVGWESKVVQVWGCGGQWTCAASHSLPKRPMALDITTDSTSLLVADKAGDVYKLALLCPDAALSKKGSSGDGGENGCQEDGEDEEGGPKPLLGHLSMLLDMVLTEDNKHIITCDRDEKIRVSCFPNAYNIHTFCLGHRQFVAQVALLACDKRLLLSCSGDGTVCVWEYLRGNCVARVDTRHHTGGLLSHYTAYREQRQGDGGPGQRDLPPHPAVHSLALHPASPSLHYLALLLDKMPAVLLYKIITGSSVAGKESAAGEEESAAKEKESAAEDKESAGENESTAGEKESAAEEKESTAVRVEFWRSVDLVEEARGVAWLPGGELLVVLVGGKEPLQVLEAPEMNSLPDHPLVTLAQANRHIFQDAHDRISIDILFKQNFDNVSEYKRRKEERLREEEEIISQNLLPLKLARWCK